MQIAESLWAWVFLLLFSATLSLSKMGHGFSLSRNGRILQFYSGRRAENGDEKEKGNRKRAELADIKGNGFSALSDSTWFMRT